MTYGEHLANFYVPWAAALAASTAVTVPPEKAFVVMLGGFPVPVLTCVLGAIGVLAARPLVRQKERALSLVNFLLVSLILLVAIEVWIIQSKPDWLFAFVIAVGLGFTGYSLIEMVGDEISELATRTLKRLVGSTPPGVDGK